MKAYKARANTDNRIYYACSSSLANFYHDILFPAIMHLKVALLSNEFNSFLHFVTEQFNL